MSKPHVPLSRVSVTGVTKGDRARLALLCTIRQETISVVTRRAWRLLHDETIRELTEGKPK